MRVVACTAALAACNDDSAMLDEIPSPPLDASGVTHGNVETFAIDAIYLGDTDRLGGPPTADAWRMYGFDLDHRATVSTSTDTCTVPHSIRPQSDGAYGIDNSFGFSLMSVASDGSSFYPLFPTSDEINAIRDGSYTLQLQFDGLPTNADDAVGISMQAFPSGRFAAGAPAFDTTTDWPVLTSAFVDGGTFDGGALFHRLDGYVTHGTFVSGAPQEEGLFVPVLVRVFFGLAPVTVLVHHATITFTRVGDALRDGIIAGVLDPTEFGSALQGLASGCKAFANAEVTSMLDSLDDGTNAPGVPCTRISIGLGFTARKVANPTMVTTDAPPCSDAGITDSASE